MGKVAKAQSGEAKLIYDEHSKTFSIDQTKLNPSSNITIAYQWKREIDGEEENIENNFPTADNINYGQKLSESELSTTEYPYPKNTDSSIWKL